MNNIEHIILNHIKGIADDPYKTSLLCRLGVLYSKVDYRTLSDLCEIPADDVNEYLRMMERKGIIDIIDYYDDGDNDRMPEVSVFVRVCD